MCRSKLKKDLISLAKDVENIKSKSRLNVSEAFGVYVYDGMVLVPAICYWDLLYRIDALIEVAKKKPWYRKF